MSFCGKRHALYLLIGHTKLQEAEPLSFLEGVYQGKVKDIFGNGIGGFKNMFFLIQIIYPWDDLHDNMSDYRLINFYGECVSSDISFFL